MAKRVKRAGTAKTVKLPLSGLDEARGRWRAQVQAGLGDAPNPKNRSGIEVKPLYTPEDWPRTGAGRATWRRWASPASPP